MLVVNVPLTSELMWDDDKEVFVKPKTFALRLEHSLVSLSKWEAIHEKPFLDAKEKTSEETFSYIRCMLLDETPEDIFLKLTDENVTTINEYISAKMTATWFKAEASKRQTEIITSEIIYYWMIALNIPWEVQHWHLNRLMTLIQVINRKNAPPKKMSPKDLAARNKALNEQRMAEMKTRG